MGTQEIIVVGHVTEVYGPVQALANYLKKRGMSFLLIMIPFAYCSVRSASAEVYKNGQLIKTIVGPNNPDFKKLYAFYYLRTAWFTLSQVAKYHKPESMYIGIDNLNAFLGLILKRCGFVDTVIYYVIDYTKKRFLFSWFNRLYHFIDKTCVKYVDCIWNISERIAAVRNQQGVLRDKNMVVPVGVEREKIVLCRELQKDKNLLVAVSHITESKGIQLVIEVISELKDSLKELKLHIIGTGPYEETLRRMVVAKGVDHVVKFLGPMGHDELFAYLPRCGIALATYTNDPNSITYYADPTKPKEYLACGLPIIITRVPWIADLVERTPMGIAIDYNREELKVAVSKLVSDKAYYDLCRENALAYASTLSWDTIYDKAFMR